MALDAARQESFRYDVICCMKSKSAKAKAEKERSNSITSFKSQFSSFAESVNANGILHTLLDRYYAPVVLHKYVKPGVVVLFFFWLCCSLAATPRLDVGLDQVRWWLMIKNIQKYLIICWYMFTIMGDLFDLT